MADYEQQETQFHAEHEEEVRALYQQKQHLVRQFEEMNGHYQQLLEEQDQQVCTCVGMFVLVYYLWT